MFQAKHLFKHLIAVLTWLTLACGTKTSIETQVVKPIASTIERRIINSTQGQRCTPKGNTLNRSDCADGYICLPNKAASSGTCLLPCGKKNGQYLEKNHLACPKNYKCLLFRDLSLNPYGMFCHKPASYNNALCPAPLDQDSCSNGLSCLPTSTSVNNKSSLYHGYRCKKECLNDSACSMDQNCLYPSYHRLENQTLNNKPIKCSINQCDNNEECSCNKSMGFYCEQIIPGLDIGQCKRALGICGKKVPLARVNDFISKSFIGQTCNEKDEARICDLNDPNQKNTARSICYSRNNNHEGICLAICQKPQTNPGHNKKFISCPKDYRCNSKLAHKLDLYSFIKIQQQKVPCNPYNCIKDQPCPNECGLEEAECIAEKNGSKRFFCASFYKTCEK